MSIVLDMLKQSRHIMGSKCEVIIARSSSKMDSNTQIFDDTSYVQPSFELNSVSIFPDALHRV
jgi:hypothetical protein